MSAAVEAPDPAGASAALRRFVEPRFLPQTRAAGCAGATDPADPAFAADDLDAALDARLPGAWRVHYHVPLHAPPEPPHREAAPAVPDAGPPDADAARGDDPGRGRTPCLPFRAPPEGTGGPVDDGGARRGARAGEVSC
ncbi:hypothetical protein [Micromonospora sp. WMMB482]|uniref:hypothetical protein n=1 Tax=Micromonospora sp. WMMB482 TaxID=2849653 RepID=UPI0020B2899B|nr:hypothetical protein [Micromonospora sp. WMMB482]